MSDGMRRAMVGNRTLQALFFALSLFDVACSEAPEDDASSIVQADAEDQFICGNSGPIHWPLPWERVHSGGRYRAHSRQQFEGHP